MKNNYKPGRGVRMVGVIIALLIIALFVVTTVDVIRS